MRCWLTSIGSSLLKKIFSSCALPTNIETRSSIIADRPGRGVQETRSATGVVHVCHPWRASSCIGRHAMHGHVKPEQRKTIHISKCQFSAAELTVLCTAVVLCATVINAPQS